MGANIPTMVIPSPNKMAFIIERRSAKYSATEHIVHIINTARMKETVFIILELKAVTS